MRTLSALLCLSLCAPAFAQAPATKTVKKVQKKRAQPIIKSTPKIQKIATTKLEKGPGKNGAKTIEKPLPAVVGQGGMIIKVNGEGIPLTEFNSKYERFTQTFAMRKRNVPNRIAVRYRNSIAKRLVEDELIRQETKRRHIKVPKKELDEEFGRYKEMFKGEGRFERYLKTTKLTVKKVKENLTKTLAIKALLKAVGRGEVTDKEVFNYYKENEAKYNVKEQVRASHILLKLAKDATPIQVEAARKKAEQLSDKARKGEDFAKLAKDNSEGPTARKGGDLNFFARGRMVKEFDAKVFSMKKNEISKPVRTRFGWHVIKMTDHKPARVRPFEKVKKNIDRMISNRKNRQARSDLLEGLKNKAKIIFLDDALKNSMANDPRPMKKKLKSVKLKPSSVSKKRPMIKPQLKTVKPSKVIKSTK